MTREASRPRYSPRGPSHLAMWVRAATVPVGRVGILAGVPPAPASRAILAALVAVPSKPATAADCARADVV